MSVLLEALLLVHCQVFGSSVHFPFWNILSLGELKGSTKRKVVLGFNGAPVASSTPAVPGPANQSPAPEESATSSPTILNPPAGTVTGATPAGGEAAWAVKENAAVRTAAPMADLVRLIRLAFQGVKEGRRLPDAGRQRLSQVVVCFKFELPVFICSVAEPL